MAQTFTDWNNVPAHIEAKIRKMWNGCGTVSAESGYDRNNDKVEIYRLASYKVGENVDYLTNEQKLRIFEIASERSVILHNLLHNLSYEIETVRVHNEIYHLPGIVVGTWPHCGMFGGLDETGHIHT